MSMLPEPPPSYANPRPGVLKTLGILNIVFAILGLMCIGWSSMLSYIASSLHSVKTVAKVEIKEEADPKPGVEAKIEVESKAKTETKDEAEPKVQAKPSPGVPMAAGFNPLMGFEDKNFVRFNYFDNGVGLILNILMFATGIGLINLRRWGARGWGYVAWIRIVSVFAIWSYFIVGVAPGLSETTAKDVLAQLASQGMAANRLPPLAFMTQVYSITYLIVAVGAMLFASIYPAISLWLLSRPGVKAAIVDKPTLEQELP
jgi:hypothetical protein